jgi:acetate kinase
MQAIVVARFHRSVNHEAGLLGISETSSENSSIVRARICADLDFLGVQLDATRNNSDEPVISTDTGRVCVRVIVTDEKMMIAKAISRILDSPHRQGIDA